ncbi:MAG: hypothetical protein VX228_03645, partial [Pseudomonadota bacterium]|nr:hypothetical protein [Pseudomonadota bacterium]
MRLDHPFRAVLTLFGDNVGLNNKYSPQMERPIREKLQALGIDVPSPPVGADGLPDDAHAWMMFYLENAVPWRFEDVASGEDLLLWLDFNTDQNVWTDLVLGMNYDLEVCEKALLQMLRHPECSQLVAIATLQHTHAELYFG